MLITGADTVMNSLKSGKFNSEGKKLSKARLAEVDLNISGFLKYFRDRYGGKPIRTEA